MGTMYVLCILLCVGGFSIFWQMDGVNEGRDGMELGGHWAHLSCRGLLILRPAMGLDRGHWGDLVIDLHFLGRKQLAIENGHWQVPR